ncbi:MAG: hypothetical protein ABIJ09_07425, partial [Pseudomonadota bacterium]
MTAGRANYEAQAHLLLSRVRQRQDEMADAWQAHKTALALTEGLGMVQLEIDLDMVGSSIARREGQPERASALAKEAPRAAANAGFVRVEAAAHLALAEAHLSAEDEISASIHADRARTLAR